MISPNFPLELTRFFHGKHLIHFLVLKMQDFRNFVLHNCILVFDSEQVYLKLQVTNVKNKEVTVSPKPQTLEKKGLSKTLYPIPYTLYPIGTSINRSSSMHMAKHLIVSPLG